jgi:hypothetical protein
VLTNLGFKNKLVKPVASTVKNSLEFFVSSISKKSKSAMTFLISGLINNRFLKDTEPGIFFLFGDVCYLPHGTPYIENFSICEACNWKKQELSTDKPARQRTIN